MTIKAWEMNEDEPEWETLTPDQREFLDFINKLEWEGGILELWNYGGSSIFPELIRQEAEAFGNAADTLDKVIHVIAKELDIQL